MSRASRRPHACDEPPSDEYAAAVHLLPAPAKVGLNPLAAPFIPATTAQCAADGDLPNADHGHSNDSHHEPVAENVGCSTAGSSQPVASRPRQRAGRGARAVTRHRMLRNRARRQIPAAVRACENAPLNEPSFAQAPCMCAVGTMTVPPCPYQPPASIPHV